MVIKYGDLLPGDLFLVSYSDDSTQLFLITSVRRMNSSTKGCHDVSITCFFCQTTPWADDSRTPAPLHRTLPHRLSDETFADSNRASPRFKLIRR